MNTAQSTQSNQGALSIDTMKAWAKANKELAQTVVLARAFHAIEVERVAAYIEPLFETFSFVDEDGKAIESSESLYLSEDDELMSAFYDACDAAHHAHGFEGKDGHCPALEAESLMIQAENALLDSMSALIGANASKYYSMRESSIAWAITVCLGQIR